MDKRTITETIIALETAALDAWHNGGADLQSAFISR